MLWRGSPGSALAKRAHKAAMRERVEHGTSVGILGNLDGVPSAWCSVAPRRT